MLYSGSGGFAQLPDHGATPAEFEAAAKISEDSVFELWSCTKLVTVVAALQLWEQGKLDLSVYVPELKDVKLLMGYNGDEPILVDNDVVITPEMLITHTAGLALPFGASARPSD